VTDLQLEKIMILKKKSKKSDFFDLNRIFLILLSNLDNKIKKTVQVGNTSTEP